MSPFLMERKYLKYKKMKMDTHRDVKSSGPQSRIEPTLRNNSHPFPSLLSSIYSAWELELILSSGMDWIQAYSYFLRLLSDHLVLTGQ